jgi:hypothetical protein
MSAAVHWLYALKEANADPFTIPPAPFRFVCSDRDREAMRWRPTSADPRCGCGAAHERQPARLSREREAQPSSIAALTLKDKGEVETDNLPLRTTNTRHYVMSFL